MARAATINVPQHVVEVSVDEALRAYGNLSSSNQTAVFNLVRGENVFNGGSVIRIPVASDAEANELVTTINASGPTRTLDVPSNSRGGIKHTLTLRGNEAIECTCESFTLGGKNPCRHMQDHARYGDSVANPYVTSFGLRLY